MKIILPTLTKILPILAIACAMAAFTAPPTMAQTAKKLQCKGCVKSKQLKNNGIKSKDIKDGQVRNSDLGESAVNSSRVEDGSLTGSDVAARSIPSGDLSNSAGGDFAVNPLASAEVLPLSTIPVVYRSFSLTVPSAGQVILNASGAFAAAAGGPYTGACSISKDGALDSRTLTIGVVIPPALPVMPFGITWAESVAAAGTQSWNLVCLSTTAGLLLSNAALTATFVPERY